jgi:glycosyltransferase involved in cell wall biosynthesis
VIVAEHASAEFGGEAVLPLHYFRVLREKHVDVWLVVHSRTRDELSRLFPGERRIHYVEDTQLHRWLWRLDSALPAQIAYITTGFVSRIATQLIQRRLVRHLVKQEGIDIVHQPIPVSPREPSLMYDLGAPVIIGPMNGGMVFPPAFRHHRSWTERGLYRLGAMSASAMNWLMPGKRRAALLLVANQRSRDALPKGLGPRVESLVENGVDLTLWREDSIHAAQKQHGATFLFLGRLIDLKAVDLLLLAFHQASSQAPMRLLIAGDGLERERLEQVARQLGILADDPSNDLGKVRFLGWLPQQECAQLLGQVDCLVLPSLRECGGAVILEAMAMAKPVIATAWGGPLDYLDDNCGVLVEPTDREAIVTGFRDAMARLACSPDERARLGHKGRLKVVQEYDWSTKVDAMLRVYRDVAKPHARDGKPRQ